MKMAPRMKPHSFVTAATEDTKIAFFSSSLPQSGPAASLFFILLSQVDVISIFCWITATSSFGSLHFPGKFGQAQAWN